MVFCVQDNANESLVQRRTFWEVVSTETRPRGRAYTDSCLDELGASLLDSRSGDESGNDECSAEKGCHESACYSELETTDDEICSVSSSCSSEPDSRTTIVLRTSSRDMRGPSLCKWLDERSFRGCYDFVYVPANFKKMVSFGYVFVNFLEHSDAERALCALLGQPIGEPGATVEMTEWSDPHQGIDCHLERFRNCPVMHRSVPVEFKPIHLRDGVPAEFPQPTQEVVAPREFRRQAAARAER